VSVGQSPSKELTNLKPFTAFTDSLSLLKAVLVLGKDDIVANYFTVLGIHTFKLYVNR
jgi:hypothetical protein